MRVQLLRDTGRRLRDKGRLGTWGQLMRDMGQAAEGHGASC